jgi:hypothetical protein
MYVLLLKYLPHIAVAVLIIGLAGVAGYKIHDNGRQIERTIWLEWKADRDKKEYALVDKAQAAIKAEAERQHKGLMEVINAQAELNNKLESDIANLNDKRMYVSAKQTRCDSGGVPTKAAGSGQSGSGASRVELSETFAREVQHDYFTAQRVVNQYEACRQELMNIADVIYD